MALLSDSGYCLQTFRFFPDGPGLVKERLEKDGLFQSEFPCQGQQLKQAQIHISAWPQKGHQKKRCKLGTSPHILSDRL